MNIKLYKDVHKRFKNELPEPLEEVGDDAPIGETYVTSYGTRVRKTADSTFEVIKSSDLIDDLIENLTPTQLKLFWNIMNYDTSKS